MDSNPGSILIFIRRGTLLTQIRADGSTCLTTLQGDWCTPARLVMVKVEDEEGCREVEHYEYQLGKMTYRCKASRAIRLNNVGNEIGK